jgi:hypothetical protein
MGYGASFEQWIGDRKFHNLQTKHIAGTDNVGLAIKMLADKQVFVGLVECFDESLIMLRRQVSSFPLDIRYRKSNVATDSRIKTKLLSGSATRRMLECANRTDIEFYEVVRQEHYPKQKKEFGPTLTAEVDLFKHRSDRLRLMSIQEGLNIVKRNVFYKPFRRYHCGVRF